MIDFVLDKSGLYNDLNGIKLKRFKHFMIYVIGVIVFGSDQEVAELMKAVKRRNATGQFFWIGSDGWSARALVSDGKIITV